MTYLFLGMSRIVLSKWLVDALGLAAIGTSVYLAYSTVKTLPGCSACNLGKVVVAVHGQGGHLHQELQS